LSEQGRGGGILRSVRQGETIARWAAGLVVVESAAGEERQHFNDVASLVYYLKVVSEAVLGFDVDVCRPALLNAHVKKVRDAPLVVRQRRFLLVASRPG